MIPIEDTVVEGHIDEVKKTWRQRLFNKRNVILVGATLITAGTAALAYKLRKDALETVSDVPPFAIEAPAVVEDIAVSKKTTKSA